MESFKTFLTDGDVFFYINTTIFAWCFSNPNTVEAPVSGHPREAEKVSSTSLLQSLYELEFKRGFVQPA